MFLRSDWRLAWRVTRKRKRKQRRIATKMKMKMKMKMNSKEGVKYATKSGGHSRSAVKRDRKKASKDADNQNPITFLPLDVVANILYRLPVKILKRFCCVCKEWCSLMSKPDFIIEQHTRALGRRPDILSWVFHSKKFTLYGCDDDAAESEDCSFPITFGEGFRCRLSNSVNGLVCGYLDRRPDAHHAHHYLLNPATREHIELSRSDPHWRSNIGLAFDVFTGEYKVVKLFRKGDYRFCCCQILTVGTQQWRDVGHIPCKLPRVRPVFVNGALHWMALIDNSSGTCPRTILVFDVRTENFHFISPPQVPCSVNPMRDALTDLGGHLCFVQHPDPGNLFMATNPILRICVLRDYSRQEWTEEHTIDLSIYIAKSEKPRVIGIRENKMFFLWFREQNEPQEALAGKFQKKNQTIYSYDLHTGIVQGLYSVATSTVEFFTASLVSPRYLSGNPSIV